jgi:hypothetical protein
MITPDAAKSYISVIQQHLKNGTIPSEARDTLDQERIQLGLSPAEAQIIEDKVLSFLAKSRSAPSSSNGAPPSANIPTAGTPTGNPSSGSDAHLRDHRVRLEHYGREFLRAIRLEFPPGELLRRGLKQSQQALSLTDKDVEAIETKLTQAFQAQKAAYQANLQQYEQEFAVAIAQGLPLDAATQDRLWTMQKSLGLQGEDVAKVEGEIISQRLKNQGPPSVIPSSQAASSQPLSSGLPYSNSAPTMPPPPEYSEESHIPPTQIPHSQPSNPLSPSTPTAQHSTLSSPHAEPIVSTPDVDYDRLHHFLEAGNWKQADQETLVVMLKATDRTKEGWLNADSITRFSCADLHAIDQLWREYSHEQFGFRAQWQIYSTLEVSGVKAIRSSRGNQDLALKFCKKVGWWFSGLHFLKYYSQLSFTQDASPGHFPAYWFWSAPWWQTIRHGGIGAGRGGSGVDTLVLTAFMKRLQECEFD